MHTATGTASFSQFFDTVSTPKGIENYNRLQECRELRSEIEILKWNLNITIRRTNEFKQQLDEFLPRNDDLSKTAENARLKDPKPPRKPKAEAQMKDLPKKSNRPSTKPTVPTGKPPKKSLERAEPLALFDGETSLQSVNSQVRDCAARVQELELVQHEFDSSQDFLRLQMHQRFAALENRMEMGSKENPAFSAFISSDLTFTYHEFESHLDAVLSFDTVIFNDGSGYNPVTGEFRIPRDGVYVFHLSLHVTPAVPKKYADTPPSLYDGETERLKTCVVKLRKNRQELMQAASKIRQRSDAYETAYQNYEELAFTSADYVTLSITLVAKLAKDDVIDAIVIENPSCVVVGRKSAMISTFQGYYLHG